MWVFYGFPCGSGSGCDYMTPKHGAMTQTKIIRNHNHILYLYEEEEINHELKQLFGETDVVCFARVCIPS